MEEHSPENPVKASADSASEMQRLESRIDTLMRQTEEDTTEIERLHTQIDNLQQQINDINFRMATSNVFKRNWLRLKKLVKYLRPSHIRAGLFYLRTEGFAATIRRYRALGAPFQETEISYSEWIEKNEPSYRQLQNQRAEVFPYMPLISIAVPTYNTKRIFLEEMIASLEEQTYPNWELCIADGNSENRDEIEHILKQHSKIKYVMLDENKNIVGNSNEALKLCKGEFIGLLDHDDTLAPFCLYEVVKAINKNPDADMLYSDEDKFTVSDGPRFEPHFKPDFSPNYLNSCNYITHFSVFKKSLMDKLGGFREGFDGSQDHDLILRATEAAKAVVHIPKILYHWRVHDDSTAKNIGAKSYAVTAGEKAVAAHLERIGTPGTVESIEGKPMYRVHLPVDDGEKVSVIIPNKDHIDDLKKCLDSILEKTTYRNYEIIIVENNSTQSETFDYYDSLKNNGKIRILYYKGDFNFSKINNFAAKQCDGKYLLFLNNDTEIITPNWIEELVMLGQQENIGAVGAKLLYPNDTIQHAGVVIGMAGIAGHIFSGFPHNADGYFGRLKLVYNYSAVTGACMLVKHSDFDAVGGFEETLAVAFNDIDLCEKLLHIGKYNAYTPFCELYHYESKSRGSDVEREKNRRFRKEIKICRERWNELEDGDPFYNPNLSLFSFNCALNKNNAERAKLQLQAEMQADALYPTD